ncbi:nitroreductase/quinone reductase family protein [Streptomyces ureilyticus]|uniref:Nitroreductase family deazaflavin-dependent oxidoreductase n=1 Tax=Streptomyces ureilyticus TaxID=1775131 RepID=A0ABX0DN90_9ACTN|nr:nitroreductase/quinone reductase family protein [Streptomyces ureilyticus]NGO43326.1 nitroreductase family deazaflavin-dependent oxidoreductase [Streptomyces ureilyticus]
MPNDFNQQVIEEFRSNAGQVGGYFEGARLLLLTTTGARTGTRHTTPVGYLPDGDRVLVIASAGGAPKHPDWFRNLLVHPQVTVETGVFTFEARAVVLADEERDQLFARAVEAEPGWAEYEAKTDRVIPVVALHEIPSDGPPNLAASSMGEALRAIHDVFRRELALIRKEFADAQPGTTALGAQLRVNCLTVCQHLHAHHTHEDAGMFPALAARHPELAPTIERLSQEHEQIAALVEELKAVIDAAGPGSEGDPTPVRTDLARTDLARTELARRELVRKEVDRLTDALEAHLTYEEEQLIPILDAPA